MDKKTTRFTKASIDSGLNEFLLTIATGRGISINTLLEQMIVSYLLHETETTAANPDTTTV